MIHPSTITSEQAARTLFDAVDDATIAARFEAFDRSHPEVYRFFVRFAHEARGKGYERFSADAILHRVRWETLVNMNKDGGWKINDHFSSRYARKLVSEDPAFEGFFEFRTLRSA